MFCSHCGAPRREGANFCIRCGSAFQGEPELRQPPQQGPRKRLGSPGFIAAVVILVVIGVIFLGTTSSLSEHSERLRKEADTEAAYGRAAPAILEHERQIKHDETMEQLVPLGIVLVGLGVVVIFVIAKKRKPV
jgi:hypothetical protein